MYPSVFPLQRNSSLGRTMHPRVAHCSVQFKPGPIPPALQPAPSLPYGTSNIQYSNGSCEVEQDVLRMVDAMRSRQEREASERVKRAELAAARALREDEELRDAELKAAFERADAANKASQPSSAPSSSPVDRDVPSTVRIAAPVASHHATTHTASSANNPVRFSPSPTHVDVSHSASSSAAPVSRAADVNFSALQDFQSITGVDDRSAASLLLSVCDNDLDRAVGLYFDSGQIQEAIDRAIAINERRQH